MKISFQFDGTRFPGGCGFADASSLVATIRATEGAIQSYLDTTAEPGRAYTYYVSAVDRLWNESNPSPPHFVR